jgi:hypothetical protein
LNPALEYGQADQHPSFLTRCAGLRGIQEVKLGMAIPLLHVLLPAEYELKVDVEGLGVQL